MSVYTSQREIDAHCRLERRAENPVFGNERRVSDKLIAASDQIKRSLL